MGFRVLLIAVTGRAANAVHQAYGVVPTGPYNAYADPPVSGALLPSGEYLLYIWDEILPDDRVLARLSDDASLTACYVNETVMNSLACGWQNGIERWSVFHDAQQGIEHLEVTGSAPAELKAIQEELTAEQASHQDADYIFDIPINLFAALGGIRYDEDIEGAGPTPWQVLKRTPRTTKKRWCWPFGG